jgi:hypothetical protein
MISAQDIDAQKLSLEVIVSEDDTAVYVKLTGFDDLASADNYASYLVDALPLLLFESEVKH